MFNKCELPTSEMNRVSFPIDFRLFHVELMQIKKSNLLPSRMNRMKTNLEIAFRYLFISLEFLILLIWVGDTLDL